MTEIIVLCIAFLCIIYYQKGVSNPKDKVLLSRLYLQDRNIQDKIYPLINMALEPRNEVVVDFTNIEIEYKDGTDFVKLEVYTMNNESGNWNPVIKRIGIEGSIRNGKCNVLSINDDLGSVDIGQIIPNISNIPLNRFYRNRSWSDHKKNWDVYKKDWDVRWANIPINRDPNPFPVANDFGENETK